MTDTGGPGDAGGRGKPHGLVRPYVLNSRADTQGRPTRRDASESLTRGDQPPLDWTRSDSTGRDAPPRKATAPLPVTKPAGHHRALRRGASQTIWLDCRRVLAERRGLAAIVAGVAALAVVGGMILFLSWPSSKLAASACRTADCPHRAVRTSGGRQPHAAPRATHPTARPVRTPRATASPTPTSTPSASPAQQPVRVSYAVVRQHPNSFQGQFTIVNNGSTAINGWELVVVLPGADIRSVSNALFHTSGDTLYIDPPRSARSIAPGATLVENFTAHGSTTTLTSCTFNGAAC